MPVIRFTAFYKDDDGHGWSETHDLDGGASVTSLTARLAAFNNLIITTRRPMLAGDAFYIGCRASYPTASNANASDNIELDPPLQGAQTYMTIPLGMGEPSVAIKMRLRNDASTAKSDVYTRGQWTQTASFGVLDFGSVTGAEWKRRADIYAAALIAGGYGWVGINPALTSRGKVTGYAQETDGTVLLNITQTNGIAIPVANTRLTFEFSKINRSKSVLNRSLVCTVLTGAATCKTAQQIAVSEFETEGHYIAKVTGFIPYAALTYYKLGHRKTGRPFGVEPGRLPAKTLH